MASSQKPLDKAAFTKNWRKVYAALVNDLLAANADAQAAQRAAKRIAAATMMRFVLAKYEPHGVQAETAKSLRSLQKSLRTAAQALEGIPGSALSALRLEAKTQFVNALYPGAEKYPKYPGAETLLAPSEHLLAETLSDGHSFSTLLASQLNAISKVAGAAAEKRKAKKGTKSAGTKPMLYKSIVSWHIATGEWPPKTSGKAPPLCLRVQEFVKLLADILDADRDFAHEIIGSLDAKALKRGVSDTTFRNAVPEAIRLFDFWGPEFVERNLELDEPLYRMAVGQELYAE